MGFRVLNISLLVADCSFSQQLNSSTATLCVFQIFNLKFFVQIIRLAVFVCSVFPFHSFTLYRCVHNNNYIVQILCLRNNFLHFSEYVLFFVVFCFKFADHQTWPYIAFELIERMQLQIEISEIVFLGSIQSKSIQIASLMWSIPL